MTTVTKDQGQLNVMSGEWIIDEGVTVSTKGQSAINQTGAGGLDLHIGGTVKMSGDVNFTAAIDLVGANNAVTNEATGVVEGRHGIIGTTDLSGVLNEGVVEAKYTGIGMTGDDNLVENTGVVRSGENAIAVSGDNNAVLNNGKLFGSTGVVLGTFGGQHATLQNAGLIKGTDKAISGFVGDDAVTTSGRIVGDTHLLAGNDTFSFLDGSIKGKVFGGFGDDTYHLERKGLAIVESKNEGSDTVETNFSYTLGKNFEALTLIGGKSIDGKGNGADNVLTGNNGANTLVGLAGQDVIDGGKGDDVLVGGAGSDTFVFAEGQGRDHIADFAATDTGSDLIDLTMNGAYSSFAEMADHMAQVGDNVVIAFNGNDRLIIEDIELGALTKGHFDF